MATFAEQMVEKHRTLLADSPGLKFGSRWGLGARKGPGQLCGRATSVIDEADGIRTRNHWIDSPVL